MFFSDSPCLPRLGHICGHHLNPFMVIGDKFLFDPMLLVEKVPVKTQESDPFSCACGKKGLLSFLSASTRGRGMIALVVFSWCDCIGFFFPGMLFVALADPVYDW